MYSLQGVGWSIFTKSTVVLPHMPDSGYGVDQPKSHPRVWTLFFLFLAFFLFFFVVSLPRQSVGFDQTT